jgi:hypothetical protein
MADLEIPLVPDRGKRYRFFEILPGLITWFMLMLPFALSLINVTIAVFFILGFILLWFGRSVGISIRALQGYRTMEQHKRYDWSAMIAELESGEVSEKATCPKWHRENVERMKQHPEAPKPSEIIHVAMIATYKERREVVEPTIQSVIDSNYDMKKVILILAYEERGGDQTEEQAKELIEIYKDRFLYAVAIKHPKDMVNEIIGKGGNISFAGRQLKKYLEKEKIDPMKVAVTTLDADNRPDKNYFAALSYTYVSCLDPVHISFQPIPMYTNNIWDAPAPMRVVATGNSFYNVVLSLRPHMLRNFSSHAQSMQTLIDTDFWSARTVVEDGHQFWRTYFRYDGNHVVFPIYLPIYQDAVFSDTYTKSLKAQFIQLRRWTYGASDISYVVDKGYFTKNKIPKGKLTLKFFRLLEGHVSWAIGPLLLAFSAFVPVLFNPQSYAANELPLLASRVETLALLGILATLYLSMKSLPPKPERYKAHRTIFMILQWVYLPVTTIGYNSVAALYSQTRLMFGWYYDKFDVTDKAVIVKNADDKLIKIKTRT